MKTLQFFDYEQAFSRHAGWLSAKDQERLRNSCVAIAGLGGAGGFQVQVLARLGVGRFKIADADVFEITNINRQIGAKISTLGQSKAAVTQEMILEINPEAKVEIFRESIGPQNIDAFLDSADLALDGIDFFEADAKLLFFKKCREKNIPALTACPLGFGASLLIFSPTGMKYEDYFDLCDDMSPEEKLKRLTFGLSPSPLCLSYMNKEALNVASRKAGSVSPGLMLVAASTGTEAVKILTGKSKAEYCPHIYQIDLFTRQIRKKYYRWGMKSPWQRLRRWLFSRIIGTGPSNSRS